MSLLKFNYEIVTYFHIPYCVHCTTTTLLLFLLSTAPFSGLHNKTFAPISPCLYDPHLSN